MKSRTTFALVLLLVSALSAAASTITFTGPTAPTTNDGQSYTGFYTISVNPTGPLSNPITDALCLWAGTSITGGQTWNASLFSLVNYESLLGAGPHIAGQIAFLYTAISDAVDGFYDPGIYDPATPHGGIPAIHDAVWTISGVARSGAGAANVNYWITEAQNNWNAIGTSNFSVYAPVNQQGAIDLRIAQPFLVQTTFGNPPEVPEPATYFLSGFGLIGMAVAVRRRCRA